MRIVVVVAVVVVVLVFVVVAVVVGRRSGGRGTRTDFFFRRALAERSWRRAAAPNVSRGRARLRRVHLLGERGGPATHDPHRGVQDCACDG